MDPLPVPSRGTPEFVYLVEAPRNIHSAAEMVRKSQTESTARFFLETNLPGKICHGLLSYEKAKDTEEHKCIFSFSFGITPSDEANNHKQMYTMKNYNSAME